MWHLVHNGTVVAEIVPDKSGDFPWMSGTLTARRGFAAFRALFADLHYCGPEGQLTLVDTDDDLAMAEFWLRLDADRAVFRWTEPDEQ